MRTRFVKGIEFPDFQTPYVEPGVPCDMQSISGMDDDEFTSYRNRLTKCVTTVAGDDGKTNTGDALNSIFVEFSGEPRLLFMAGEEIGILIGYDMGTRKVKVDLDAIEKQIAEIEKGMKNAETDSNR